MSLSSQRHSAISQGQSSAWLRTHTGTQMPLVAANIVSSHSSGTVPAAGVFTLTVEGNLPYQSELSGPDLVAVELTLAETPSNQGYLDTEAAATWIATQIAADASYTSAVASGGQIVVTVAGSPASGSFSINNYPDITAEGAPALPQDGWQFPTP